MPRNAKPRAAVDRDGSRSGRTGLILFWLAVPVMIALGGGVGYIASEAWTSTSLAPGAVAGSGAHSGHEGHGAVVTEPSADDAPPTDDAAAEEHADEHAGHAAHGQDTGPDQETVPDQETTPDQEPSSGHDAASDHDAASGHGSTADHATASDPVDRPRTAVLTTFAGAKAAILLAAALSRRNSRRPRPARRVTARAA